MLHFPRIEHEETPERQNSSFYFVHIFKDSFIKCLSHSINKAHSVPHGNNVINCM